MLLNHTEIIAVLIKGFFSRVHLDAKGRLYLWMDNAKSSLFCKLVILQVGVDKNSAEIDNTIHTFLLKQGIE